MKIKRRTLMAGAAGAVIGAILLVAGLGACCRTMGPGCFHSRFGGPPSPERILKTMDQKVARLDLSEAQQAVYDRMRGEFRGDLVRFDEGRKDFREEVRAEMAGKDPNARAVAARVKEGMDRLHVLMAAHVDRMVEFYEVLDEEQRQEVLDHVRERMDRCGS